MAWAGRGVLARKTQQARANPDPTAVAAVDDARRTYTYVSAADYIETLVSSAPALTPAQRDKLALLLRAGGDHAS